MNFHAGDPLYRLDVLGEQEIRGLDSDGYNSGFPEKIFRAGYGKADGIMPLFLSEDTQPSVKDIVMNDYYLMKWNLNPGKLITKR